MRATFVEPKLASFWSLTLPVAPYGRVHAGAVEDGLLSVEVVQTRIQRTPRARPPQQLRRQP